MIRQVCVILILLFLMTSCGGGAPAATEAPASTESPATESPATEEPLTQAPAATEPPAFQSLEAPTQPVSRPTSTPQPAATQTLSTPTETPLPTLELPTGIVNPPAQLAWDGAPTYLAESAPGYVFRVSYDPEVWALTTDQFGFPALGHRHIPNCVVSVTSGRGLPLTMTVDHNVVDVDGVLFDVGSVFENGVLKFITYTGNTGTIMTAFQVNFEEQADVCRADAARVIFSMVSVPASRATPTP